MRMASANEVSSNKGRRSPCKTESKSTCLRLFRFRIRIVIELLIITVILISFTVMAMKNWSSCLLTSAACCPKCHSAPACVDGWIGYRGKCYYFSEVEGNWTHGQNNCAALGASLAAIDTLQDLKFMLQYKGTTDPWIGLQRDSGHQWKWANGSTFNNLFEIRGDAKCAYLKENEVFSSRCYTIRSWICNKPYA